VDRGEISMRYTIWVWSSDIVHAMFEAVQHEHFDSWEGANRLRQIKPGLEIYKITVERNDKQ